jgi:hypothetical protein
MHVEPPTHAPTNLKELGIHYLMIVLGILTALGLEAGFEAWHHRRLANRTIEQVEVELRANLAEVRSTLRENQKTIAAVDALYAELKTLARQDKPAPDALSEILNQRLRISIFTPGLRRDAWDTAVADQALMHMPHDALRRLAEAYTAQREAQLAVQTNFNVLGSFSRLTDAAVDAEFGRVDAVEALKALRGYRLTLTAITGIERDLERQLAQSLGEPAPAAAAAPASAASAR